MGATNRVLTFAFCANETELFKRWKEAQGEDTWEKGHGIYQGSIGRADLTVSRRRFATLKEAEAFADSECDNIHKGEAVAYRFGEGAPVFPATAKDRDLVALHKKLDDEFTLFEHSILVRFVQSKSASKRCSHCESVISKKSRERLSREPYLATLNQMTYLDQRDYVHSQTSCPACGHNLLLTDTDQKRKKSLEARLGEVKKKLTKAEADFKAKAKPYGYYVYGWVPS